MTLQRSSHDEKRKAGQGTQRRRCPRCQGELMLRRVTVGMMMGNCKRCQRTYAALL
jgi:hypothetical protein